MSYQIHIGSNLDVLPTLPDNSVDAIVTDPPYGLEFMGKEWDAPWKSQDVRQPDDPNFTKTHNAYGRSKVRYAMGSSYGGGNEAMVGFQEWYYSVALEMYRVLKPGGHILSFGGSRTYHRMACAIEDAGFEVRDQIMWVYGSGFPKSHNISKAMDKSDGIQGEIVGYSKGVTVSKEDNQHGGINRGAVGIKQTSIDIPVREPASEDSRKWDGWGTALKPAHEPICVARKPLEGTVVENVRKWGVGGLNIDGCRVEFISEEDKQESIQKNQHADFGSTMGGNQVYGDYSMLKPQNYAPPGRWPANLIHDGSQEVLELFPQTGVSQGGRSGNGNAYGGGFGAEHYGDEKPGYGDKGSAARFFYCPKASKSDRNDGASNNHPTVKPTDLMAYLCRLVTPPAGTILDPFTGSGSTGRGAVSQGFNFIGIELSAEYAAIAEARIKAATK